jgi:hypothetical protein
MKRNPPPRPRLTKAPPFKEVGLTQYLDSLSEDIVRELYTRATVTEPVFEVLLTSPAGKVWSVTISDAGILTATEKAS